MTFELDAASDTGVSDDDGITNSTSLQFNVTTQPNANLRLLVDSIEEATAVAEANGSAVFSSSLTPGPHTVSAVVEDAAGNLSAPSSELPIVVDLIPPTVDSFGLEATSDSAPDGDGQTTHPAVVLSGRADEEVHATLAETGEVAESGPEGRFEFVLVPLSIGLNDFSVDVTDLAGNQTSTGTSATRIEPATRFRLSEMSPAAGEELVSVTRPIRIHFERDVDPTTVHDGSFTVMAAAQQLQGTVRVSSTLRFATFLPTNPLPPSTEVQVVVQGDTVRSSDGDLLDGDRDGVAGGTLVSTFRTLPLTRVPDTDVFGYVYDAFTTNPDGSDVPIVGATIRVDAFPEASVITDENGFFMLEDMPAPDFFVHIDGSTATNAPAGMSYPSVGKAFHSVPGQSTQLSSGGEPFDIYLPQMSGGDMTLLSETASVDVGFGPAGEGTLAELFPEVDADVWSQLQVTFPPGSAMDRDGNAATEAMIVPVPPDRLPAPLPFGADAALVVSIQAPGATSFDVPAPIQFPNLNDRPLGSTPTLWSFDHARGDWVAVGTGTVIDDGQGGTVIVSDADSGIRAPGWHWEGPPQNWGGDGDDPPSQQPEDQPPIVTARILSPDGSDRLRFEFNRPKGDEPQEREHEKKKRTKRIVNFTVEGDHFTDFYKPGAGKPIITETIDLSPNSAGPEKEIREMVQMTKDEIIGGKPLDKDRLYGAKIKIVDEITYDDGSTYKRTTVLLPYLYLDYSDDKTDSSLRFRDAVRGVTQKRELDSSFTKGAPMPEFAFTGDDKDAFGGSSEELTFSPNSVGKTLSANLNLEFKTSDGNATAKGLRVSGEGQLLTKFLLNKAGFLGRATALGLSATAAEDLYTKSKAKMATIASSVGQALIMSDDSAGSSGVENVSYAWLDTDDPDVFGRAAHLDFNVGEFEKKLVNNGERNKLGMAQQVYLMDSFFNRVPHGSVEMFLGTLVNHPTLNTDADKENVLASVTVHEAGHILGLVHSGRMGLGFGDLMNPSPDRRLLFTPKPATEAALKMSLGVDTTVEEGFKAIEAYLTGYRKSNGTKDFAAARDLQVPGDVQQAAHDDATGEPTVSVLNNGEAIFSSFTMDSIVSDGVGGLTGEQVLTIENPTGGDLEIVSVEMAGGGGPFAVDGFAAGTVLHLGETMELTLRFDPMETGLFTETLVIRTSETNLGGDAVEIQLSAEGLDANPVMELILPANNNLGGVALGDAKADSDFLSIVNRGAADLVVTPSLELADGDFDLGGLAGVEHALATGQRLDLPLNFHPTASGLRPDAILLSTNDPQQTEFRQGVVGTGVPAGGIGQADIDWGRDYIRVSTGGFVQNVVSNLDGGFQVALSPNLPYSITVFDPQSGYMFAANGFSGPAGSFTDMTTGHQFRASLAADSDGDGLPNDIEDAVGSDRLNPDTNGDGVNDFATLAAGFSPVAGVQLPTGILAALPMLNGAADVATYTSADGEQLLSYVATAEHGLAIVDVTDPMNPAILSQLDLVGNATGIDIDPELQLAAVATNEGGLQVIDVSAPARPRPLPDQSSITPSRDVRVKDGVAFAVVEQGVELVDMLSGSRLDALIEPDTHAVDVQGDFIYVVNRLSFSIYERTVGDARRIGGLDFVRRPPEPTDIYGLTVADDLAYIGHFAGYLVLDVSDPANPSIIGSDMVPVVITGPILNGTGLMVAASSVAGPTTFGVRLFDASEPTDTSRTITNFPLPDQMKPALAVAQGIATIAGQQYDRADFLDPILPTGEGAFYVLNYLPFDNLGVPPTVELTSDIAADELVVDGGLVPVNARVTDDFQIRNVEVLVNGVVVANDVSFPFDFTAAAVPGADGDSVTIQARATDTGGNTSLSNVLTFTIDQTPPRVIHTIPAPGTRLERLLNDLTLQFDRPVTTASNGATAEFLLVEAGNDGLFETADDLSIAVDSTVFSASGLRMVLGLQESLAAGHYRLTSPSSQLVDASGDGLDGEFTGAFPTGDGAAGGDFVLEFSVAPLNIVDTFPRPESQVEVPVSLVSLTFNRAIATDSLTAGDFQIISAGADGQLDTSDDTTVTATGLSFGQSDAQVIVSLGEELPLGLYRFRAASAALRDLTGSPLDGEHSSAFPTGDGAPGGDFVMDFERALPPPSKDSLYPFPSVFTGPFANFLEVEPQGPALFIDLNSDGAADIVRANWDGNDASAGSLSLLVATNDGNYSPPVILPVSNPPRDLAQADFDGDGVLDIVTLNHHFVGGFDAHSPVDLSVFLGRGDGTVEAELHTTTDEEAFNEQTGVIETGDFDLDGNQDVVALFAGGFSRDTRVVLFPGLGDGRFGAPTTTSLDVSNREHLLASADFNGDGQLDLVTQTKILLNDGGTFTVADRTGVFSAPSYGMLVAADFTGDGVVDVISGQNQLDLFTGAGDGTFARTESFGPGLGFVSAASAGDWNADGHLDLVLGGECAEGTGGGSCIHTGRVSLLVGDGNGSFAQPEVLPISFASGGFDNMQSVHIEDFNGDGRLDVVAALSRGPVVAALTTADGNFEAAVEQLHLVDLSFRALGDLNGDGFPDLVGVADRLLDADRNLLVYLGQGNGEFAAPTTFLLPDFARGFATTPRLVEIGDLDGDGDADVVVAISDSGSNLRVLLGNGDGTLATAASIETAGIPQDLTLVDIDADGIIDLVMSARGVDGGQTNGIVVRRGRGDGTFEPELVAASVESPASIEVGDFDADGTLDVAFSSRFTASVGIFRGLGDGRLEFVDFVSITNLGNSLPFVAADVNQDGALDLLAYRRDELFLALGNDDGTFLDSQLALNLPRPTFELQATDLNHDGIVDLLLSMGDVVGFVPGQGNGLFADMRMFELPRNSEVLVGDLDQDGLNDLVGELTTLLRNA